LKSLHFILEQFWLNNSILRYHKPTYDRFVRCKINKDSKENIKKKVTELANNQESKKDLINFFVFLISKIYSFVLNQVKKLNVYHKSISLSSAIKWNYCVCVWERERKSVCDSKCVFVCKREKERVCVSVCIKERKRVLVCVLCVCVRERERQRKSVCEWIVNAAVNKANSFPYVCS